MPNWGCSVNNKTPGTPRRLPGRPPAGLIASHLHVLPSLFPTHWPAQPTWPDEGQRVGGGWARGCLLVGALSVFILVTQETLDLRAKTQPPLPPEPMADLANRSLHTSS